MKRFLISTILCITFLFNTVFAGYYKQDKDYNCGPTVILNIFQWAGYNVGYDNNIMRFEGLCGCGPGYGTSTYNLNKVLKMYKIEYTYVDYPTIGILKKHLEDGGCFILMYSYKEGDVYQSHYSLCVKISDSKYSIVNHLRGASVSIVTESQLQARLDFKYYTSPNVWLISPSFKKVV